MTNEEVRARLEAINYIIENDLYSQDMEEEILSEAKYLAELLLGPNEEVCESDDILDQRRKQYGSYDTFIGDMSRILNILSMRKDKENPNIYTVEDIENFFFVLKLLRLQTATDLDSLVDLSNYAKLAKDRRESN